MRIALLPPSHCSVCFNQDPMSVHVDCEAATDGPVVETDNGNKISIDDIIVCERCVREAFSLLPESFAMREELVEAHQETKRAWEYAASLKNALEALKIADGLARRAAPPKLPQRPKVKA